MIPLFVLVSSVFEITSLFVNGQGLEYSGGVDLNVLVLVPWPDGRDFAVTGWDNGLDYLAGARVAVKEINNRTDVLFDYHLNIIAAGHEACDLTEERFSIANLVYYAVNPNTDNVAAILGLYCSASTFYLSPIAGSRGIDLIHMSSSNSPIFKQNLDQYPHHWRFLQSASVFADMMIQFMETYDWTRVGMVQDLKSAYFAGIADAFVSAVRNSENAELVYHGGLIGLNFITEALSEIRSSRVRIIFLSATEAQIASLLCAAANLDMLYPNYMWVVADYTFEYIVSALSEACDEKLLLHAMRGSVMSFFDFGTDSETIIEPSMITYGDFVEKYNAELDQVRIDYQQLLNETGDEVRGDIEYAGFLYDQVWTFALAVNDTLPELELRNISIEDYGFGQPNVTEMLEVSLGKLNFRGVSGQIQFNDFRETGPPVAVFQITNVGEVPIGKCPTISGSISCTQVNIRGVIEDDIKSVEIKYPLAVGIFCILFICGMILMISLIFSLLLYYRAKPAIKATSPLLSSLMFLGCYLLCFAALFHTLYSTFDLPKTSFAFVCNAEFILGANGCNLIFVTLFIKLYRISRIFNNKQLSSLSWAYKNYCMSIIVLILCCLPNIIIIIMLAFDPLKQQSLVTYVSENGLLQDSIQHVCYPSRFPLLWFFLIFGYLGMFIALIVYLAINNRKIQHKNFKDTKKVNAFVFLTLLSFSLPLPCGGVVLSNGNFYLGNGIIILGFLILATLSQVMLFLPKVFPTICEHKRLKRTGSSVILSVKKRTSLFFSAD